MTIESFKQELDSEYEGSGGGYTTNQPTYFAQIGDKMIEYRWDTRKPTGNEEAAKTSYSEMRKNWA